ncbi:hypothetical protein J4734_05585 [Klebsiella pneumoniae]|uniref:Uncharacterized protein n=1 Tax=Klebsiella pneumoniae TaxID=573 RepID=A0A939NRS7_KLEPN|nr:hypothetical protein [Klebsiella pneumoniae]
MSNTLKQRFAVEHAAGAGAMAGIQSGLYGDEIWRDSGAYRHRSRPAGVLARKKRQTEADSAWLSRLPQNISAARVLVCGDAAASLFTENPLRQVAEGCTCTLRMKSNLSDRLKCCWLTAPHGLLSYVWPARSCRLFIWIWLFWRDDCDALSAVWRVRRRAGMPLLWSWLPGTGREDDLPWFICAGGRFRW